MNLPMVNIYKFHKKEMLIQPPGEPQVSRWHSDKKKFESCTKLHKRRNDWKGQYTKKWQKSLKWSHRNGKTSFLVNLSENFPQIYFLGPVTSILTFLQISKKCYTLLTLSVNSSFIKNFVAQTFRTVLSLQLLKI